MGGKWRLVFLVAAISAHAQTNSVPLNPSDKLSTGYEREPFGLTQQKLRKQFKGYDAETLYRALYTPPKNEYETSAAYQARLNAVLAKHLYGSIQGNSAVAFILRQTDTFGESDVISWSYDADTKKIQVQIDSPEKASISCEDCPPVLITKTQMIDSGSYVGQTAFGVRSNIKKHYIKAYGVAVDSWPFRKDYEIEMEVAAAEAAESHLRLILIGHLIPPWTSDQEDFRLPAIDSPQDFDAKIHAVYMHPEQLWVVNVLTGDILSKEIPEPFHLNADMPPRFRPKPQLH